MEQSPLFISKPINKENGFSLIELIIAVMVLAIALVGIAAVLPALIKVNRHIQETNIAMNTCRAELNKVLANDFASIPPFDGTTFGAVGLNRISGVTGPPGLVSVDSTDLRIHRITVSISWEGISGVQSLDIVGYVAEDPPP